MTALMQVLHRVTREENIMVTSINNGRSDSRLSNAFGMFVKTLPVVSKQSFSQSGGLTVADMAKSIQEQFRETQSKDFYPFTKMSERHQVHPEIMCVYQGGIFEDISDDTPYESLDLSLDTVKFPLYVTFYPKDADTYGVTLEYDTSLYCRRDMESLASMLKTVSEESAETASLKDISLLSDADEKKLSAMSTGSKLDYDRNETIVDMFVRTAESTPDAPAVVFKDRQLTYGELDKRTSELASHLQRHYGIGRGSVVGIMIDRSELMAVYPLSVMKAGGAYMPLDSKFPSERLQFMCEDAGVSLILSEGSLVKDTMPDFAGEVFTSDMLSGLDGITELDPLHKAKSDDLMVVLYTSGSTGKPKGCLLEHHNIVNFCHWYVTEFSMTSADRALAYANFGFDAHMMDQYPAYLAGACVYIIPSEMRMDISQLNDYMEANHISIGFMTTQLGYILVTSFNNHSLRLLSVGGEKLPPIKKPPYRFYNGYGPTECSLYSTFYKIESDYDSSLIGRPLSGYQLLVADRFMRPVPAGVPGELIILGDGVGRGYLNRPELNAEKFITIDGQRAYRSGDLVRWTEDGNIDFMGRIDGQVKLRGLRIETGEVESVMSRYAHIKSVCVTVKEVAGTQHLFGYYTSDGDVEEESLREFMGKSLTAFMIPEAFIRLDVMPLTPNGKIDRKLLPLPEIKAEEIIAPETELEKQLFEITSKLLGQDQFGVTTNLISVGMSSLMAMRLSIAIRQQLNLVVETKDILAEPTLRHLAAVAKNIDSADEHVWEKREYYPITENQRGVYVDWELNRDTTQYNIPNAMNLHLPDADKVKEALIKVVDAHPYLKTRFAVKDDDIVSTNVNSKRSCATCRWSTCNSIG